MRICLTIAVLLLSGCSTAPSQEKPLSPLVIATCVPTTPLTGETFADVVNKLAEVASTYNECRKALGLQENEKNDR